MNITHLVLDKKKEAMHLTLSSTGPEMTWCDASPAEALCTFSSFPLPNHSDIKNNKISSVFEINFMSGYLRYRKKEGFAPIIPKDMGGGEPTI